MLADGSGDMRLLPIDPLALPGVGVLDLAGTEDSGRPEAIWAYERNIGGGAVDSGDTAVVPEVGSTSTPEPPRHVKGVHPRNISRGPP